MSSDARGELFIVSAPSGAGKTTLIKQMMEAESVDHETIKFSVSHTTRKPRLGEVQDHDYHFVDAETFQEMVKEGRFLEWAQVHDHHYGTSYDEVLSRLSRGVDVVLDIDVQGAEILLNLESDEIPKERRHGIFVMPPSYDELRRRLELRGLNESDDIDRRMRVALREVQCCQQYEYVIVNDSVSSASRVLASIILAKRHRRQRMRDSLAEVLADFSRAAEQPKSGAEENAPNGSPEY